MLHPGATSTSTPALERCRYRRHLTAPCAVLVAAVPRQAERIVAPDAAHRAAAAARGVAGQAPAVRVAAPAGGAVAVQGPGILENWAGLGFRTWLNMAYYT